MSDKDKIAEEVAEAEFIRLCELNRIEHDATTYDEAELKDWNEIKDGLILSIRRGHLVVGEDGKPTFTLPGSSKSFTFNPPTGATLMALETYAGHRNLSNLAVALAEMTKSDRGEFGKMPQPDFNTCLRIFRLFSHAA